MNEPSKLFHFSCSGAKSRPIVNRPNTNIYRCEAYHCYQSIQVLRWLALKLVWGGSNHKAPRHYAENTATYGPKVNTLSDVLVDFAEMPTQQNYSDEEETMYSRHSQIKFYLTSWNVRNCILAYAVRTANALAVTLKCRSASFVNARQTCLALNCYVLFPNTTIVLWIAHAIFLFALTTALKCICFVVDTYLMCAGVQGGSITWNTTAWSWRWCRVSCDLNNVDD